MQLVTEQTREMDDRQAALKKRYDAAKETLQSYRDKVEVLQKAYENSIQREGEGSKTTMQWRASLIAAQTEVAKQENLLKSMSSEMSRTSEDTRSLADVINGLAGTLGISLPPRSTSATLAGLILERLGHIPVVGERLRLQGWELEIIRMDRQRIDEVRAVKTVPVGKAKRA